MFGKLKEKLKGALSVFSKRAEQEAEVKAEEKSEEIKETISEALKEEIIEPKKAEKQNKKNKIVRKNGKKAEPEVKGKKQEKKQAKKELIPADVIKITYFVHGTTIDNEKEISSGWSDVELSELGIKQSIDLKDKLKEKQFDVVFCSDLKRSIHSAKLTFEGRVKIIPDSRLRECNYGKYNAQPSKIVEPLQEKQVTERFPDGESYEDVKARIGGFLDFVRENYAGKEVAIVAHKAPQLALDVLLKNKTWKQAFAEDWRKTRAWKPGWEYELEIKGRTISPEETTIDFIDGKTVLEQVYEPEQQQKAESPETEKKGFFGKLKRIFSRDEETADDKTIDEKAIKETPVEIPAEAAEGQPGFFSKVKQSFTTKKISAEKFEELFWELEVVLLENNVSVEVVEKIKENLKLELVDKPLPRDVAGKMGEALRSALNDILTQDEIGLLGMIKAKKTPFVIAFFGVNGAGKTTSIAKLAHYLKQNKLSVVLAAGDTFRAAAIQQLQEHADKLQVPVIKQGYGADAAAVAFDAVKYARKNNIDVVLIDTAGRLHSNTNLMAELEKIIRVARPDFKLFVGESITGNDCVEQARKFNDLVQMDGVILTKADVDEKGGAPLSISYVIGKPILFLGVGQKYQDLEPFDREKMLAQLGF